MDKPNINLKEYRITSDFITQIYVTKEDFERAIDIIIRTTCWSYGYPATARELKMVYLHPHELNEWMSKKIDKLLD